MLALLKDIEGRSHPAHASAACTPASEGAWRSRRPALRGAVSLGGQMPPEVLGGNGKRKFPAKWWAFRDGRALVMPAGPVGMKNFTLGARADFEDHPPSHLIPPPPGSAGRRSERLRAKPLDGTGRCCRRGPVPLRRRELLPPPPATLPRARGQEGSISAFVRVERFCHLLVPASAWVFFPAAASEKSISFSSMLSRNWDADAIVIGLIGERGREVMEFIEDDLGKEGLSRSGGCGRDKMKRRWCGARLPMSR